MQLIISLSLYLILRRNILLYTVIQLLVKITVNIKVSDIFYSIVYFNKTVKMYILGHIKNIIMIIMAR